GSGWRCWERPSLPPPQTWNPGPLVRSSYHAKEQAREVEAGGPGSIQTVMEADIPAPAEVRLDLVQLELGRTGRSTNGA
ncbi:MAG: hypothetical protein ACPHQP_06060, partial [Longimicrobiales bacterium]